MKNPVRMVAVVALKMLLGAALALALCGAASAQEGGSSRAAGGEQKPANGLVMQQNLSLAMAKTIAEATLAACAEKGYHTAAAVVDRAGQVLVILRDEQATPQVAEMARRKAYTARMFRTTTMEFQKRTADNPAYAGQRTLPDILPLSGGAPIKAGNDTVGAVGSAGSTLEQDDACAKAGIAKVADLLK